MKIKLSIVLAGLFLAGCTTADVSEPVAEAAAAPAEVMKEANDADKTEPAAECDPKDPSCDHTGTVFKPPTR